MSSKSSAKPTPMTMQAAGRIQSSAAKASGGHVKAGTFAPRAQSAAATNQALAKVSK